METIKDGTITTTYKQQKNEASGAYFRNLTEQLLAQVLQSHSISGDALVDIVIAITKESRAATLYTDRYTFLDSMLGIAQGEMNRRRGL